MIYQRGSKPLNHANDRAAMQKVVGEGAMIFLNRHPNNFQEWKKELYVYILKEYGEAASTVRTLVQVTVAQVSAADCEMPEELAEGMDEDQLKHARATTKTRLLSERVKDVRVLKEKYQKIRGVILYYLSHDSRTALEAAAAADDADREKIEGEDVGELLRVIQSLFEKYNVTGSGGGEVTDLERTRMYEYYLSRKQRETETVESFMEATDLLLKRMALIGCDIPSEMTKCAVLLKNLNEAYNGLRSAMVVEGLMGRRKEPLGFIKTYQLILQYRTNGKNLRPGEGQTAPNRGSIMHAHEVDGQDEDDEPHRLPEEQDSDMVHRGFFTGGEAKESPPRKETRQQPVGARGVRLPRFHASSKEKGPCYVCDRMGHLARDCTDGMNEIMGCPNCGKRTHDPADCKDEKVQCKCGVGRMHLKLACPGSYINKLKAAWTKAHPKTKTDTQRNFYTTHEFRGDSSGDEDGEGDLFTNLLAYDWVADDEAVPSLTDEQSLGSNKTGSISSDPTFSDMPGLVRDTTTEDGSCDGWTMVSTLQDEPTIAPLLEPQGSNPSDQRAHLVTLSSGDGPSVVNKKDLLSDLRTSPSPIPFQDEEGNTHHALEIGNFMGMCLAAWHPKASHSVITMSDVGLYGNTVNTHKTHCEVITTSGGCYVFDALDDWFVADPCSMVKRFDGLSKKLEGREIKPRKRSIITGPGYYPPNWVHKPTDSGMKEMRYFLLTIPLSDWNTLTEKQRINRLDNFLLERTGGDPREKHMAWIESRSGSDQDGPSWRYWSHLALSSFNALRTLGPAWCEASIQGDTRGVKRQAGKMSEAPDHVLQSYGITLRQGWYGDRITSPAEVRSVEAMRAEQNRNYPHQTKMMDNMMGEEDGYRTGLPTDDGDMGDPRDAYGYSAKERRARDKAGSDAMTCLEIAFDEYDDGAISNVASLVASEHAYDHASALWMEGWPASKCVTSAVSSLVASASGSLSSNPTKNAKDRVLRDVARLAIQCK
jgi:hypothetical protein